MKVIRWIFCHLLAITLIISMVLIYSFREVLNDDLDRMLGKTSTTVSSQPDQGQVDSAGGDTPEQLQGDVLKSENAPDTVQTATIVQTDARDNTQPQDNAASQWKIRQESGDRAKDPWNRVLPQDTTVVEQVPERTMPIDPRFPPDDYDPETNAAVDPGAGTHQYSDDKYLTGEASLPQPTSSSRGPEQQEQAGTEAEIPENGRYLAALAEARKQYWDGNSRHAQTIYEKLMFDFPQQPEAAAELGNLLLQNGNRKGAVWAYQNAIERYLNLHRKQEVINLIDSISRIDPAIAESIQKKYW